MKVKECGVFAHVVVLPLAGTGAMNFDINNNATILCIDDEMEVLTELADTFSTTAYGVQYANSTEMAIAMANKIEPDLIISDINLDGESGLELVRRVKKESKLVDVPVIFLSGANIPNIVRRAHAAGGTYYLRKPCDPQVLLELVEKALWMPHLIHGRSQTV